jgi:hypothetical protein
MALHLALEMPSLTGDKIKYENNRATEISQRIVNVSQRAP